MSIGRRQARHGIFNYFTNDVYIGRSIELYGEYSEGEVEFFKVILQPGDVALDIGANIGCFTVPMAKLVGPTGKVVALEAQPSVAAVLQKNVADNGLDHVDVRVSAAGAKAETILAAGPDLDKPANIGGTSLDHTGNVKIKVITVDSLKLETCKFIKIDVEGMESEVLAGAAHTIARCRPIMYVENDREEMSAALIQQIAALNYRMWWHLPPLWNENNFNGHRENVFGQTVSINMICLPSESGIDLVGLKEVTT